MEKWVQLAKGANETLYWPLIVAGDPESVMTSEHDPAAILAEVPAGDIREVLDPLVRERRESLVQMIPDLSGSESLDELAAAADASGIYSFIGSKAKQIEPWPSEKPVRERVGFQSLKMHKGEPTTLLLIKMEHTYQVPAYLGLGGWNECPGSELHVAAFREWQKEYKAVPGCITGDVIEFLVSSPPQTQQQAMKLAAEQWIYCDDIVGQGTQSVRKLAMEIWQSRTWFFWWD